MIWSTISEPASKARQADPRARIFHLIKGLGRGGAEVLLSEGLQRADRRRFVYGYGYLLPWKNQLVSALEEQDAPVTCFDVKRPFHMLPAVFRVARHLRRWQADVVHCHLPLTGVVGRLAGRLARVPVVYTEHNLMERYHPLTRRANRWTWGSQSMVVAVSAEVIESIERHVNGSVPLRVVLNGIRFDGFQPRLDSRLEVRQRLGIPPTAPVVGTVAVFRRQKRLDLWLTTARQALEQRPDLHFILVGDGPMRGELERLVPSLGLEGQVHFVGLQEQTQPFFSAMDVFLMSSRFEGLPLALLEAMAAELPVVATAVGGVPEVVVDGKTGVLVPPDEPAEAAEALLKLLSEPEGRKTMGRAGRERVEAQFSMARMVRELESIYLEVLARRRDG